MLPSGINLGPHRRRRFVRDAAAGEASADVQGGDTFDPSSSTIKAVLAYADGLDADGIAALIRTEAEGKNRSSLLPRLEALREEAEIVLDPDTPEALQDAPGSDLGDSDGKDGHGPGDEDTDA